MAEERYHHGDLPAALLRSVRELVAEGGVGAVSVRAVARRAGVSHAAPAHHFGDRGGLLAALAAEGFRGFNDAVRTERARLGPSATVADALVATGRTYIAFGLANPEYYTVMFRPEMVDGDDPALDEEGSRAFGVVVALARACLAPGTDDPTVLTAAVTIWASVHGFVSLALDLPTMKAEYLPLLEGMQDEALRTVLDGLRAHPDWVGDDVPATIVPAGLDDPLVVGTSTADD